MQIDTGKISLIKIEADGKRACVIDCKPGLLPRPGQYLLAHHPHDPDAALGTPLFPVGLPGSLDHGLDYDALPSGEGMPLGPIPRSWQPGTELALRGPLGKGFQVPPAVQSLGLVALGESASRLLPLIPAALAQHADIAIFTDLPLPSLPPAIEIRSLQAVRAAVVWADFLALDLPLENIPILRNELHLDPQEYLSCPAQVLLTTPMPCAGLADCGVCAVRLKKKGHALACKDGPVFNLNQLAW